ncbi:MAG: NUDIX hydrolase [Gammaproteobacteria bacterium]|nr:NUDIX hydrolase [Gammaproteobacteria bacterium]MCP4090448.1 NUDIX hydrolase [Gammaproteobacteria bacterium]MCP4275423.1 NUDIX hydrolase [Gammaproteobacteria bacterium]MCP4832875.1 NUDIX hydrolase [Gammaproteobacteria bacterium]MCP4928119.1 NUDIX hydrolase [Gammaproteobacteria bacterium]
MKIFAWRKSRRPKSKVANVTAIHLTVAAVIEKRQSFLFVEELVHGRKVINQPAGHVESGESLQSAVVREMLEETAWQFIPSAIVGVYLWTHPESKERFLRVVFTGQIQNHDAMRELDEGILRTLWLSRDDLLKRSESLRSPMVLRAVDDYQAGARFPVNMFQQIEMDKLASHAQQVV